MSFMPSEGSVVRLKNGRIATVVTVTPLGDGDEVQDNENGTISSVTAWDIEKIMDEKE